MILAAGLGARLRPLTEHTPKALIEVGGMPLLERVARRLVAAGADRLIVNVHHYAKRIERFVRERNGFGVEVRFSWEEAEPLDTGGGLLAAAPLFRRDAPFLLHNVDVITDLDLGRMYREHEAHQPLATLAVSDRPTSRPLLVDGEGVYGVANHRTGWRREARPPRGPTRELGFAGVHVVSPTVFDLRGLHGAFSIWEPYFQLVARGRRILTFDIGQALWLEAGDPDRLERARTVLAGAPGGRLREETRR
ncbi:MAG: NDP-sugar synthase [Gemmatimonadota bacterium]